MNSCSTCSTDLDMNATVSYPQQNCSQFEGLTLRKPRKDLSRSQEKREGHVAACDQRILEFPLSMGPREVAKMLKAEA